MSSRVAFSLFAEQCLLDTYARHYEVTICTSNRFLTYQQVVKTNPSNSKLFCGCFFFARYVILTCIILKYKAKVHINSNREEAYLGSPTPLLLCLKLKNIDKYNNDGIVYLSLFTYLELRNEKSGPQETLVLQHTIDILLFLKYSKDEIN